MELFLKIVSLSSEADLAAVMTGVSVHLKTGECYTVSPSGILTDAEGRHISFSDLSVIESVEWSKGKVIHAKATTNHAIGHSAGVDGGAKIVLPI